MSKDVKTQEPAKNNKKYIVLALVVLLAILGIMMNNDSEEEMTTVTTETTPTEQVAATEETSAIEKPTIARIDIYTKLVDANIQQFEVYVDGSEGPLKQAGWMNKFGTQGYVIQNDNNKINIGINILNDAEVTFLFKGPWDKAADGNIVEHWVDYTSIMVNDKEILSEPVAVWHNKSFTYTVDAKSGEKIKISAEWKKHSEK